MAMLSMAMLVGRSRKPAQKPSLLLETSTDEDITDPCVRQRFEKLIYPT
jgi:hypothetical protein